MIQYMYIEKVPYQLYDFWDRICKDDKILYKARVTVPNLMSPHIDVPDYVRRHLAYMIADALVGNVEVKEDVAINSNMKCYDAVFSMEQIIISREKFKDLLIEAYQIGAANGRFES